MTQTEHIQNLVKILTQVEKSQKWLETSHKKCAQLNLNQNTIPETDLENMELLSSRFARTSDLVIQKLMRAIDELELEQKGTLLDALNRAEKRGLIPSTQSIRKLRDLRNTISHDYAAEEITELTKSILEQTPTLFTIIQNIQTYCQKKNYIAS